MRIVKYLLLFNVILLILGGVGFLLAREALLYVSAYYLKNDLGFLERTASKGEFKNDCFMRGSTATEGDEIVRYQLRFINDTSYKLEAVCVEFPSNPINIKDAELLPLVKKAAGYSGIILQSDVVSGVPLTSYGRTLNVLYQPDLIELSYNLDPDIELAIGPVNSCEGFGYSCCEDDFEQGKGDQVIGVDDCPKSCFSNCQPRPVVLAFNSQPFFDQTSRVVTLQRGQTIAFSYVVSSSQEDTFAQLADEEKQGIPFMLVSLIDSLFTKKDLEAESAASAIRVNIDYGDGFQEQYSDLQGMANHLYTCNKRQCDYEATISVTNGNDVTSADTLIGKIGVHVE